MTDENDENGDEAAAREDGIFASVVGHNGAKAVIRGALRAGDVDVLLVGPPASGKSTMLMAIEENVPGTVYRDGKRFTATRIQSVLKQDPPILLIDEIDALTADEFDVLANPMEHGRLTEDTHDEQYDIEIGTQIIATCNTTRNIPGNIESRFRKSHFKGYDKGEMIEVCTRMLPEKVDWIDDEETAREVAKAVHEQTDTLDPRDVRDAARMFTSVEQVEQGAIAIKDADADVESDPITPDQVARAKTDVGREKLREIVRGEGELADDVDRETIDRTIEEEVERELNERREREAAEKADENE